MHKIFRQACCLVAIVVLVWAPSAAFADPTPAPCILGYTVGFFNGVWNTELDAMDGMNALKGAVREATGNSDDTYNKEDVGYQLFYNHTGSTGNTGNAVQEKLQDVAEVFQQRAAELDASGNLGTDSFFLFWEAINPYGQFQAAVTGNNAAFSAAWDKFRNDAVAAAASTLAAQFATVPTAADYATQQTELTAEATAGRKMLLVAHSQGNLFVNVAYDFIQPQVGSTRVKAVHVAPASPTIRGQYILSTNDAVINALRLDGGGSSVQPNNITIALSQADLSGHTLAATYLDNTDPTRVNGRQQVEALLVGGLSALTATSTCNATVSPSSSMIAVGSSETLTVTVNPPITDSVLATVYQWTVSGTAGGTFSGSGTGSGTTTYTSTSPSVSYTMSSTAPQSAIDSVKVDVSVAKNANDLTTIEKVGTGTATVSVGVAQYVLSGPGGGGISVDDGLTLTLNGVIFYTDGSALSGVRPPITLPASAAAGQVIGISVDDTYGHCSSMSAIYISCAGSSSSLEIDPGFDLGCGRPSGDQGVVHTSSYTIAGCPAN
jgi:hypothetical protein